MQVKIGIVLVLQARMETPVTTKDSSCTDDKHRNTRTDELSHTEFCVSGDDFRKISQSDPFS